MSGCVGGATGPVYSHSLQSFSKPLHYRPAIDFFQSAKTDYYNISAVKLLRELLKKMFDIFIFFLFSCSLADKQGRR